MSNIDFARKKLTPAKVAAELREQPDWHGSMSFSIPEGAIRISNSEISAFKRCRRKWFLHYYLGWQQDPMQSAPTSNSLLGTRGHAALQAYYGMGLDPMQVAFLIYQWEIEKRPDKAEYFREEYDMLITMLEGYAEWLNDEGQDRGIIPVAAEQEMSYPLGTFLGHEVWISAHLDVAVFDQHRSRYMFIDHKFVGAFTNRYELARNEQMKMYVMIQRLCAQASGTTVDGGIFNMLKRSKRTHRANPPFFKREHITFNESDMKSMWYRTHATVGRIMETRQQLDATGVASASAEVGSSFAAIQEYLDYRDSVQQSLVPPTPLQSCDWECPFNLQCVMMDDGSRWGAALSGKFLQGDPYEYYGRSLLQDLISAGRLVKGDT